MAKRLSAGQRAAIRSAITRRGELGLTQKQLADVTGVSERTIQSMEAGESWPRPGTLAQLEGLGLGWPVGYMADLAAKEDEQDHYRDESRDEQVARLQAEIQRLMTEVGELLGHSEGEDQRSDRRKAS